MANVELTLTESEHQSLTAICRDGEPPSECLERLSRELLAEQSLSKTLSGSGSRDLSQSFLIQQSHVAQAAC